MSNQKEDLLKSITSFITADNELAIKEAEHQIKVFNAIYEKEITQFKETNKKENEIEENHLADPAIDQTNLSILEAIETCLLELVIIWKRV